MTNIDGKVSEAEQEKAIRHIENHSPNEVANVFCELPETVDEAKAIIYEINEYIKEKQNPN